MLVRYLPLIFVLAALALALAPLEAAGQIAPSSPTFGPNTADAAAKADQPRPRSSGAPVNANAAKAPLPPGGDVRSVRPAQAFPPERFAPSRPQTPATAAPQAPTRGGVRAPDPAAASPAQKDDPRSVEERADPGG